MSFLRPDNKTDQTDNVAAQATVDPFATPASQPMNVGDPSAPSPDPTPDTGLDGEAGVDENNNDVTVTTDEGSTLHTFNDPTLQNVEPQDTAAPTFMDETLENTDDNMASGLMPDVNDANNSVNDALSFQDQDGSALTPADDTTVTDSVVPEFSTDSIESTEVTTDNVPSEVSADDEQVQLTSNVSSLAPLMASEESTSELDNIKKQALEQLRPLLEKVDLPAGEKFDKYLMMLRATDDPTLIEPAFNAAQGITEDKDKAEALVDIINEINYVSGGEHAEKPS